MNVFKEPMTSINCIATLNDCQIWESPMLQSYFKIPWGKHASPNTSVYSAHEGLLIPLLPLA